MRFDPRRVEKTELSIFDALDVGGCRCIWMYMDVDGCGWIGGGLEARESSFLVM